MGRIRTSRDWLATAGPKPRQSVEISFLLSAPGTVVFRVEELSPHCRYVGKFLVRGRSGRNVVRFRGRLRGRALPPGTYRVTAWVRGHRARQIKTTIVVFARPAGRAEIASARLRDTCEGATESTGVGGPMGGVAGARASLGTTKGRRTHGPLGAALGTLRAAADAVPLVFFAFAALAMLLLGVASMPQPLGTSRAGALLVHHRGTIALAGAGVLITGLVAFIALF
jgi:hypothetical protein